MRSVTLIAGVVVALTFTFGFGNVLGEAAGRQPIEGMLEQARQIDGWHRDTYLRPVSSETCASACESAQPAPAPWLL
jgi:hypothetical protein